jgi:hypothetical protein
LTLTNDFSFNFTDVIADVRFKLGTQENNSNKTVPAFQYTFSNLTAVNPMIAVGDDIGALLGSLTGSGSDPSVLLSGLINAYAPSFIQN